MTRAAPALTRCSCGSLIRIIAHRDITVKIDDEPVVGGDLMINVDQIVCRLKPSQAGMHGHIGFRIHRCYRRKK